MAAVTGIARGNREVPAWSSPQHFDAEIRHLDIGQLPSIQAFLSGLDQETRCRRFGPLISNAALDQYAVNALDNAALMLGIFSEQRLRGLLELYGRTGSSVVELLLVVERASRRCGLGWRLIDASMRHATQMGARCVDLIYASDNWPMRRIAQKAGGTIDLVFGTFRARIDLASRPTITNHLGLPVADVLQTTESNTKDDISPSIPRAL
jgi:GNAT superfamily N-acetyltransferase